METRSIKAQKIKELGQYPAILTSRMVNNTYLDQYNRSCDHAHVRVIYVAVELETFYSGMALYTNAKRTSK